MSNPNANDYKYWAFISYSHQDNLATRGDGSGDHIQWANWLHEQLETYRVPDGYRDRTTATDEPMPERFFPTFRDEAELPTSHDLGGQIHDALRRSRFLIVIASPRSAASRYVNEEVRYFRQLGRGNRILTLIIDGEPNVRLSPKTGWSADDDCFGPALVHPLRNDGSMNETASLPEEPIAADVRVKEAEPPREMRASERAHADRQGLLDFMKLKLIAGLMGVGLDELVQRDKRRAEEQLKRSRQELSRTEFLFARQLLDLKDYPKAYAHLAKSIADDPENRAASTLGLEELRGRVNRGFLRQQVLYKGEVIFAVFCPDGARILTAFNDHTARIWDAATGRPLADPLRHSDWVRSAVFSPDGTQILTTSDDNTARLWDTATGRPLAMPLRHEKRIESAVFSPDGTQILTTSDDNTAQLLDSATGRPLAVPLRHEKRIKSAFFSPDGMQILTTSDDNTARLWDTVTGRSLIESLRHEGIVTSAVFSPDGAKILTTTFRDNIARIWDATTGRPLAEPLLRHSDWVRSAVFSPDGTRILTVSDHSAQIWDAATGRPLARPLHHGGKVDHAVFSPDGVRILTTSREDYTARIWDAATGHPLSEPLLHRGVVCSAVFSPDGARILTTSRDHTAKIWDAVTGIPLSMTLCRREDICSVDFSPDGTRILTASNNKGGNGQAQIRDTATGRPLAVPLRHEKRIESAVFSPDGTQILTASDDHTARLWDTATGRSLIEPLRHTNWVRSALFSPDGARIMTRAFQETARLWDAASGCPLVELAYEDMYSDVFGIRLHSAVFSPDGTRILTVSESDYHTYTVRLWDTATGRVLAEPLRHEGEVCNAVFSPDGARILATSDDNVHLWDAATGRPLAEPLPHGGKVDHAVFSPDGARILTASDDNVYLWDAANEIRDFEDVTILRSLLEIGGNHRLNAYSFMEPVPSDAVGQIRGEMDATDVVCKPLCWWWADPFSRTIHPSSAITVPEFVRHRIGEVLDAPGARAKTYALQDALNAFPHHPLVLLCLVEQGNHGDPAWLAQHAVSRLLTEPHYLTPIQSRMTDADHAARAYELKEGLAEDCYLGARLLQRQKRPALAKQVIARACKLVPANKTYQQFASQL